MAANFTIIPFPRSQKGHRGIRHALMILVIAALLVGVTALVYASGGSDGPFTYVMLLPPLIAAGAYGVVGGVGAGLVGGILIGPAMPQEVARDLAQSPDDWIVRLAVFAVVGLVVGAHQRRFQRLVRSNRESLRSDPSTGLPNQAAFIEDLAGHLVPKEATETRTAAVLLRATDFNETVEVLGVDGGDHMIGEIGHHLERVCSEVQGIYRFSTSELALIVEADGHEALKRIARTLHSAAAASFEVDGVPVRMEPALGIGHSGNESTLGAQELLRRARVALRRAVSLEREWVSYEPAFDTDAGATLELIARAEAALEAGEFELHYQPKVRLADHQPAGVEALARWRRPDEGIVAPGSFMPKLEQTSLIEPFSRFVIRTATDYARTGPLVPVSINLAPRNLADDTLVNALIEGLRETGTPPEALEVEVTESALMREPDTAIALLSRLREHGVGVSIDDFGTGYASFSYLRRIPATNLKIDRAFVRPIEGDTKTRRLVLAMIEAGHALGLTVTAEGVETAEQARILQELECDLGQGFLWSAACPEPALREWLASAMIEPS